METPPTELMTLSSIPENSNSQRISWNSLLGLTVLGVAFFYVWILPLLLPRGDFLSGHYRLTDIYVGIPIGLAFISAIAVFAIRSKNKRLLAFRLTAISISATAGIYAFDIGYAFGVNGVWKADYWLDQAHIPRRYSVADAELGFVRKPQVSWNGYVEEIDRFVSYRTDENGFRNPLAVERADIVFIGDSLTEAAQVDDQYTFVRRVEKAYGSSVVNLGRGAYGPQQELIVLQRYGLAYRPRVVVWQIFEGNDLTDAHVFAEWKKNPNQSVVSFRDRYAENSLLAEIVPRVRRSTTVQPEVIWQHNDGTESRIPLRYGYDSQAPAKDSLGFAETTRAIESGYRLCQSREIKFVVVMVPTMVRVMEPFISFASEDDRTHYLPNGPENEKMSFSGKLAEFCSNLGCSFINTFDELRKAATVDNRNLYIPVDEHLDVRGHEVVAQTILQWLQNTSDASTNSEIK